MPGSGRKALADVREWLEGPPKCPGVVGRPSRMAGSGGKPLQISGSSRESLPDIREWSGGPSGYPEVVGRTSTTNRMFGSGRENLWDVWERQGDLPRCP